MRRDTCRPAVACLLFLAASVLLEASQAQLPAFRRVAIRETDATSVGGFQSPSLIAAPGGRFEARNASIADLARLAFNHDPGPVEGKDGWVERFTIVNPRGVRFYRYAIDAEAGREWTTPAAGESFPPELRVMLRRLLEERFAVKARVETRRTNGYVMRLSEKTRAPGPSLVKSANECVGPTRPSGPFSLPLPVPAAPVDKPRCAFRNDTSRIEVGAVTMDVFAYLLSRRFGGPVVDQTGLNGTYDVHLVTGLPDLEVVQRNALAGGNGSDSSLELLDMRVPFAIRGAMKQQLGLELHETKLSIPTLVIERWNRPR